ncbi:MAG: hypothetical protein WBW93_20090 [Steroidobacteraceae bacterium]
MTRAYQRGHACKVLRVEMMLPCYVPKHDGFVREAPAVYRATKPLGSQEIFPENFLTKNRVAA